MNDRGAGTIFVSDDSIAVILVVEWSVAERGEHINVKETKAAVRTMLKWLSSQPSRRTPNPIGVALGVDNRTGVKAVSLGFYPGNGELSAEIWSMHEECERAAAILWPMYVPGDLQVADEATRLVKAGPSKEKCVKCRAWMMETIVAYVMKRARSE